MNNSLANESLEIFLRRKNFDHESKRKAIDWESRKRQWLVWLDKLYKEVNDWLSPLKREGIVKINYENSELSEDYIGSYPVQNMTMTVGAERVALKPKGMVLVNSSGRVDMIGDDGSVMFILIAEDQDNLQWHVAVRTPHIKYWLLTKDSFTEALKQVMQK